MRVLHFIFLLAVAAELSVPAVLGVPMVNTELDRGIAMANVAATLESVFYEQAEEVYVQVQTVLPKISGLSRADHTACNKSNGSADGAGTGTRRYHAKVRSQYFRRSAHKSLSAEAS